jgi:hypothetical protein
MNIDEDTCEWLGCPTPLEMYKHHAALLEDEVAALHIQLRKARENIAGLVQMNDVLATGKAEAEEALKLVHIEIQDLKCACTEPGILSMKLVAQQRDHLLRENQRILLELSVLRGPQP